MSLDLDKLEELARKATQGQWEWVVHDASMASLQVVDGDPLESHVMSVSPCTHCTETDKPEFFGRCTLPSKTDADFIEAMSPETVLELIQLAKKGG